MSNAALVGLSSQIALQRELDVVANNVANVNTTGFKAAQLTFQEYLSPRARENRFSPPDRVMRFVQERGMWHDHSQGSVQTTGNPLDVAIDGAGFLVVQTPNGERYTRNGSLQINNQGQLVTTDGSVVLGDNGPILFQQTDRNITIAPNGRVSVLEGANNKTESQRGNIRVVTFAQAQQLTKEAGTTFAAPAGGATPANPARVKLIQGALEKSNVNGVSEMTRLIEITRTYTNVANLLQQQNDLRKSAIQQLAEVPT